MTGFRLITGERVYDWAAVRVGDRVWTAGEVAERVRAKQLPSVNADHVLEWLGSGPKAGDVCVWYVSAVWLCCEVKA